MTLGRRTVKDDPSALESFTYTPNSALYRPSGAPLLALHQLEAAQKSCCQAAPDLRNRNIGEHRTSPRCIHR
jgi:hypothetical protein